MTKDQSKVFLFLDDEKQPIAELETPIVFNFDTNKIPDGDHVLKIISTALSGREGVRLINFKVKNGPTISVEGLAEHDIVEGSLPLMINAYDKGLTKSFVIEGSETPQTIPVWVFVMIMIIAAWSVYYLISNYSNGIF